MVVDPEVSLVNVCLVMKTPCSVARNPLLLVPLTRLLLTLGAPSAWCGAPPAADAPTGIPDLDAAQAAAGRMPKVVVTGEGVAWDQERLLSAPLHSMYLEPTGHDRSRAHDSAALLGAVPGAAVVRNGPQTGIVQLRGLQNERVRLVVDGMTLTPACPNHMDPPLHYLAPTATDTLMVMAGVTPVSLGGDSIAGTVVARPAPPRFFESARARVFGELGGSVHSDSDGWGTHGTIGVANRRLSAAYSGSWQSAGDFRFPGGRVRDTGYQTTQHGLLLATQTEVGLLAADLRLLRTRDAGTPALPMDMLEGDGYRVGLRHAGEFGFGTLESRVYRHEVDHLMDNYSLRPPGPMRMFSRAESDDTGARLDAALPGEVHTFRLGTEFHRNEFSAFQQNALTGAQQDTLRNALRQRVGTYLEWQA
ncbi:MAG: hypothetical protein FJ387_09455 [Verrucomicrobia bacterium]|nr:hypothetical protein [Verrucomicrobiota bacterium]